MPSDLFAVYFSLVPRYLEGKTANDHADDKEEEEDDSEDPAATELASENANLGRLTEAIKLLHNDSNSGLNNDATAYEEGVTMEDLS